MNTYLHGPMDYVKTLKQQFRLQRTGICQNEERGIPVVGRRKKMHTCALVAKQKRVELTLWETEMYKEERGVFEETRRTDE